MEVGLPGNFYVLFLYFICLMYPFVFVYTPFFSYLILFPHTHYLSPFFELTLSFTLAYFILPLPAFQFWMF